MTISRRSFLIGTGAIAVTAAIPLSYSAVPLPNVGTNEKLIAFRSYVARGSFLYWQSITYDGMFIDSDDWYYKFIVYPDDTKDRVITIERDAVTKRLIFSPHIDELHFRRRSSNKNFVRTLRHGEHMIDVWTDEHLIGYRDDLDADAESEAEA